MSRDDRLRDCQRIVFEVWARGLAGPERQKRGEEGLAILDAGGTAPAIWRDDVKPQDKPKPKWVQAITTDAQYRARMTELLGQREQLAGAEPVGAVSDSDGGMGERE
jgi:hypothetical protein